MPKIVRRCTITNQYLDFCKEKNFSPRVAPLCGGFLKFWKPPKVNSLKVLIIRRQMTSMVLKHFTKFLDEWKEDGCEQGVVCANLHKAERA